MLSYKQLEPSLYKWAAYYARGKYDLNELVNAAWINKQVRGVTNIKYASRCIKFAILQYIIENENLRHRHPPKIDRLNDFHQKTIGKIDKRFKQIEDEEWFRWLLTLPLWSIEERAILENKYIMGKTYKEIAEYLRMSIYEVSKLAWKVLCKLRMLREDDRL